jgi:hypothetical protein
MLTVRIGTRGREVERPRADVRAVTLKARLPRRVAYPESLAGRTTCRSFHGKYRISTAGLMPSNSPWAP